LDDTIVSAILGQGRGSRALDYTSRLHHFANAAIAASRVAA
jgi:hypothetical protein